MSDIPLEDETVSVEEIIAIAQRATDSWSPQFTADEVLAIVAELDQALEALAADNKLGAFETGKTIGAAEVRKELDQAREQLAHDWNGSAVPGGVDLVAAYQAWLDWYNADKGDGVGSLSHELVREYLLSLISELLQCRRDHATGKQAGNE
jgi:hypothetical protein